MKVAVALQERSYDIHIESGLLHHKTLWQDLLEGKSLVVIVTNEVVAPLYLEALQKTIRACGHETLSVVLPDGEANKEWAAIEKVITTMLKAKCDRDSVVVSLGGGVVGDLTGFAASIYMRGVDFIQVPTSLLAQVDAAVGGKTAINHSLGKNMVGTFYQPRAVVVDLDTLTSLEPREFRCGIAEMIKHGAVLDRNYFLWLEHNMAALTYLDRTPKMDIVAQAIAFSCQIKADVVNSDEREKGRRALLNFGHTFAHAIETATQYQWLHGEAVAAGMICAGKLSQRIHKVESEVTQRITALTTASGLPIDVPKMPLSQWADLMAHDKKNKDGQIRFVLLKDLGEGVITPLLLDDWRPLFVA